MKPVWHKGGIQVHKMHMRVHTQIVSVFHLYKEKENEQLEDSHCLPDIFKKSAFYLEMLFDLR